MRNNALLLLDDVPVGGSCPYLGLKDDRATRALVPAIEHRCYRGPARAVGSKHQLRFCLGGGYQDCPAFQAIETQDAVEASLAQGLPRHAGSFVLGVASVASAFGALLLFSSPTATLMIGVIGLALVVLGLTFLVPVERFLFGEPSPAGAEPAPEPLRSRESPPLSDARS